jgi:tRNA threonylcarbamoyladenosine biosynthesis protein TsaB
LETALKLLAFDTSTDRMSVAVSDGTRVLEHEGAGGAHASASLIPAVESLLAQAGLTLASLDAVVFGRGPGSFTGLRTACAVAQGLGFGAGCPVLGLDTLLAVAEEARHRTGAPGVLAVLDARMDEVYWAGYEWREGGWATVRPPVLSKPEQVVLPPGWALAGNALRVYQGRLPVAARQLEGVPQAAALLRLAPAAIAAGQAGPAVEALPLYIRDKVAQTTDERAAARLHRESAP